MAASAPDVVLLDVRMPRMDGITALRALREQHREQPAVVMLTTLRADSVVLDALRAGALGFLLKHAPPEQIVAAILSAGAGESTVSPGVLAKLSERERDVALAVADGLTNQEIAERLHLSVGSVKAHISAARAKLRIDNRAQLAIIAHESRG